MAYEIFISRGVAGLQNAQLSITNAPPGPLNPSVASAARRRIYFKSSTVEQDPCHRVQAPPANLGDISCKGKVPISEQSYLTRHLFGANVSRTPAEGHALRDCDQTSAGAKSTGENSAMTSYGLKSEESDPPTTFSNLRGHDIFPVDQPNTIADHDGFHSQPSIRVCPHMPKPGSTDCSVSVWPVPNLPPSHHSTPERIPSEGSAKGSVYKPGRHTRASTVTSVDGNLDTVGLGGESLSVPKRSASALKTIQHDLAAGLRVRFATSTSNQGAQHSMASYGQDNDNRDTTNLFLDPFGGDLTELERQPSDISELSGYIRPHAFSRHRDTLARIAWPEERVRYANEDEDEDEGFESDEDVSMTPAQVIRPNHVVLNNTSILDLPAEILHEIFLLLQPCDFESARHACRSWFVASLDRQVTGMMMRKAGCYSAFLADLKYRNEVDYLRGVQDLAISSSGAENAVVEYRDPEDGLLSEHWLASKRLATESRLSAAWHGTSLNGNAGHTTSRLAVRETINFQRIISHKARQSEWHENTFNVSNCGRFLLAVSGRDIFIYCIASGQQSLRPTVRLVADANVLEVSMDASSRRFAVAALLEGRTGACWELDDIVLSGAVEKLEELSCMGLAEASRVMLASSSKQSIKQDEITIIAEGEDHEVSHVLQDQDPAATSQWSFSLLNQHTATSPATSIDGSSFNSGSPLTTAVKPNFVYHNLGTASDPPRSVAICPQRKCVAFGCRAGIELHWVDAVNGNNLNRWFPLAAPSDHLYFLPQRFGVDNGKKLRLISSAAGPTERQKKHVHRVSTKLSPNTFDDGRRRTRSMERLFCGNLSMPAIESAQTSCSGEQNAPLDLNSDHYRAIPLSDGQHMLFTDPATGLLCLGSDAPLGGPTKLVRKACMVPPPSESVFASATPVCYAAGFDLRWGVRIVAAYDDGRIILYNIPSDCFERLRHIRSSPDVWDEFNGLIGASDLMTDVFMLNRENAMSHTAASEVRGFRSLQIDGALVGYVDADIESLAVNSTGGGLTTWVFHSSGQATQMDVYVPREHKVQSRFVGADGLVRDVPQTPAPAPIMKHHPTPHIEHLTEADDYFGSHVRFVGLDGCCDNVSPMCGPLVHKHDIDYSDIPRDEGISMTPGASDDEDDGRPLQVELLTDWRTESLLRPYIVNVAWIDAH